MLINTLYGISRTGLRHSKNNKQRKCNNRLTDII